MQYEEFHQEIVVASWTADERAKYIAANPVDGYRERGGNRTPLLLARSLNAPKIFFVCSSSPGSNNNSIGQNPLKFATFFNWRDVLEWLDLDDKVKESISLEIDSLEPL